MEPLISVIVPIYKVEEYLSRCVDSIINQTYNNLEIILVDDGSPDNCPKICDDYAKRDNRIKVLHLENGGAGAARNFGFMKSNGDYISYIDSDDVLEKHFFEALISNFSDSVDIVECESVKFHTSDEILFPDFNVSAKVEEFRMLDSMLEHIKDRYFKQVIWNKLYRRNVVAGVLFPENRGIDDEYWTYQVIGNSRMLKHINLALYAYRQQEKSIMHNLNINRRLQAIEAKCIRHEYICNKLPELEVYSLESIVNIYMFHLQAMQRIDKNNYSIFKKNAENTLQENNIQLHVRCFKSETVPQNFWMNLFICFPNLTVKIRNFLKIGF